MEKFIKVTSRIQQKAENKNYWASLSGEARLDVVELLRLEAGKFLYEYPARLQRVISIARKA